MSNAPAELEVGSFKASSPDSFMTLDSIGAKRSLMETALAPRAVRPTEHSRQQPLTPEEDSVGDPEDLDEEIDDLVPADLWF